MSLGMVNYTYIWALNKTPFNIRALENIDPPLLYTTPSANQTGTDADTTITTQNNTWIDLIFTSSNTPPQPPHPIHKHSNKAFIIGQGTGAWNWSTVAEAQAALPQNFNTVNPPYRDGFLVPGADVVPTWLVVRYHVVNPGAILLHCHIQSHLNGGMAMVILDGVDVWPEVRGLGGYA
jgi:FtsP/CotA-like multicopper oxidase with cupredoxin domain